MTRRKVRLESLNHRPTRSSRAIRRWLWRHGILRTWLLQPGPGDGR